MQPQQKSQRPLREVLKMRGPPLSGAAVRALALRVPASVTGWRLGRGGALQPKLSAKGVDAPWSLPFILKEGPERSIQNIPHRCPPTQRILGMKVCQGKSQIQKGRMSGAEGLKGDLHGGGNVGLKNRKSFGRPSTPLPSGEFASQHPLLILQEKVTLCASTRTPQLRLCPRRGEGCRQGNC